MEGPAGDDGCMLGAEVGGEAEGAGAGEEGHLGLVFEGW